MMTVALLALMLVVAFANGANDVSKGIATLAGAGVTSTRRAIAWGTLWTVVGGMTAALVSGGLVAFFSGRGLLQVLPESPAFLFAVATGAIGWLVVATASGLPVSTTHALVGALVGTGIMADGATGIRWDALASRVVLPLALSPIVAVLLMMVTLPVIGLVSRRLRPYCVCLERSEPVIMSGGGAAVLADGAGLRVIGGNDCPPAVVARVNAIDSLHWLTAGTTSFFRGMNDAPKVLGLGAAAGAALGVSQSWLFALVAAAMGAGSVAAGSRVTDTLAGRVTRMNHNDGFAGNLVTSGLVAAASVLALPVSTTHVSTGAIIGLGLGRRSVHWRRVIGLLLAWVVTLPAAGLVAGLCYAIVR